MAENCSQYPRTIRKVDSVLIIELDGTSVMSDSLLVVSPLELFVSQVLQHNLTNNIISVVKMQVIVVFDESGSGQSSI